jgi:hypothetical protein
MEVLLLDGGTKKVQDPSPVPVGHQRPVLCAAANRYHSLGE